MARAGKHSLRIREFLKGEQRTIEMCEIRPRAPRRLSVFVHFGVQQDGRPAVLLCEYLLTEDFDPARAALAEPYVWLAFFHLGNLTWRQIVVCCNRVRRRRLSGVDAADYDAILVPGGLGPMVDIQRNIDVQNAIVRAWTTNKLVSAVCHGPCALLGVDIGDGKPFIQGKKLTAFSKMEEYDYAREDVPYELEDALRAEGADYSSVENWQPHVVVDGRLITGQNPASAGQLGEALLAALR